MRSKRKKYSKKKKIKEREIEKGKIKVKKEKKYVKFFSLKFSVGYINISSILSVACSKQLLFRPH